VLAIVPVEAHDKIVRQPGKRIQDIQVLDSENKTHLFALMDAFLRDYKAKQAYGV